MHDIIAMLEMTKQQITNVLNDKKGLTAVEYGVMATAIILAIVTVVGTIGTNLSTQFSAVAKAL